MATRRFELEPENQVKEKKATEELVEKVVKSKTSKFYNIERVQNVKPSESNKIESEVKQKIEETIDLDYGSYRISSITKFIPFLIISTICFFYFNSKGFFDGMLSTNTGTLQFPIMFPFILPLIVLTGVIIFAINFLNRI